MTSQTAPEAGFVFSQRRVTQFLCGLICATIAFQPINVQGQRISTPKSRPATVTVTIRPGHPANRFIPSHAFGAGIDGHDKGETDRQLKAENIKQMLSAGLRSLTYRLRTELAI